MNIGVLLQDAGLAETYRDEFKDFGDIYLFTDMPAFVTVSDHFDFAILDHQIDFKPWSVAYDKFKEKPAVVVATYPISYYKSEFQGSIYKELEPIVLSKKVYFSEKNNYNKIKRILEVEFLRKDCQTILNRLYCKNTNPV